MSKGKSIKINAILNVIRVGLSVIFPLITFPYASRILQVENLGKINYGSSIISYFSLLAALGVTNYAVREGAPIRDNKEKIISFSSEIFTINIITTLISYVVFAVLLLILPQLNKYSTLLLIQSLSIIFTTLSVEWLNAIYEDYLYITIRSIIVQFLSLIALFLFVKSPKDYITYAAITVIFNGLVCIMNLSHCRKNVRFNFKKKCNLKKHIKPMLIFFSNNLAVTIYVSADITMLGWFTGDYFTGLYSVSVKIYQIVKQLLTAMYTVTIPKLSKLSEKSDLSEFKALITNICSSLILVMLPAAIGLIVLAKDIITLISGYTYVDATLSLQILGIALILAISSGILVNCINIPLRKEKISLRATLIAALVNIILNFIFIPLFKQNGAACTTLISEFVVSSICIYYLPQIANYIKLKDFFKQSQFAIIECIWIVIINTILNLLNLKSFFHLFLVILFSLLGYIVILILGKNPYYLMIRNKLIAKTNK